MQIKQKMWIRGLGVGGGPNTVTAERLSFDNGMPSYGALTCVIFKTTAATAPSDLWGGQSASPCGRFVLLTIDFETG
jgi:hypothetical protein